MIATKKTITALPTAARQRRPAERFSQPGPATCKPAPPLTLELVESRAGFEALKADWDRLHALAGRNGRQAAFQAHRWLSLWCDAFAADRAVSTRLAIVVVRRGASVCLICPFALEREFALTRLVWMGEPVSQYGDVLIDPTEASSTEIAAAFDFAMARTRPDVVHLRRVRADAAVAPFLKATRTTVATDNVAPFMDFSATASYDDYATRFSAKARKNRRRQRRRLDEKGPVDVAVLAPGPAAAEAIRLGLTFKLDWLTRRGELHSALREPAIESLLCRAAACTDDAFSPFVSVMSCAGKVISVQFGVVTAHGLALHTIAYAPAWEKAGAGALHVEATAAWCVENGLATLDFLGPDAAYKREWSDRAIAVDDYVLASTCSGSAFAELFLRRSRDRLKRLLARLPHRLRVAIAQHLRHRSRHGRGSTAGA